MGREQLEVARQALTGWVSYWQRQLDEVLGGMELEVDPVGLPKDAAALEKFSNGALAALRDALYEASRDPHFADYLRSRVSKVLVRNDATAEVSRFDYEASCRKLVVITTPALRQWIDGLALQEFLHREL